MRTGFPRRLTCGLSVLAVSLLVSTSGLAAPINIIQNLRVEEKEAFTEIHVEGNQTPTFTVFKLEDPVRLFVDMPHTNLEKVDGTLAIRNGVVAHIGTLQFKKGQTPIGRIIVMLDQDALYKVESSGNNVIIRVDAAGRAPAGIAGQSSPTGNSGIHQALEQEKNLLQQIKLARLREEELRTQAQTAREEEERLRFKVEEARTLAETARKLEEKKVDGLRSEKADLEKALTRRDELAAELKKNEASLAQSKKAVALEKELAAARYAASKADKERRAALAESMVREQTIAAELDDAKGSETTLKKQLADASSSLESLEKEVNRLKDTKENDTKLAELQSRQREAESRKAELTKTLSSATKTISSLENRIQSVEADRAAQVAQMQGKLEKAVQKARSTEEALRLEQSEYRTDSEKKLAAFQSEVTRLSKAIETREGALSKGLVQKEKALQGLETEYKKRQNETASLQANISSQHDQVEALRNAYKQEESKLEATTAARQKEEARVLSLKETADNLETQIATLREAQNKKEAQALSDAKARQQALETQVAALNARITQEKARGAAENSEKVLQLQKQISAANKEGEIATENAENRYLAEMASMESILSTLRADLSQTSNRSEERKLEIERLKVLLSDAQTRDETQTLELGKLNQASNRSEERKLEIERLKVLLSDAQTRDETRALELGKLKQAIQDTSVSDAPRKKELRALRNQLQASSKRDSERTASLEEFKKELQAAMARDEQRQGQIESLSLELAANSKRSAVRDAELAALREELNQTGPTSSLRRAELEKARKELMASGEKDREQSVQLASLRDQVESGARRETEREEQIQNLTLKLTEASNRESEREGELKALRQQVASANSDKVRFQELSAMRKNVTEASQREAEQGKALTALKEQLTRTSDRDASRQQELEILRKQLVDATDKDSQRAQRILSLEKGLEDAVKRDKDRKKLIVTLEKNLGTAKARDQQKDDEVEALRVQLASTTDAGEVAELQRDLRNLQTQDSARQQALLALDAELSDTREREKNRTNQISKLQSELEKSQEKDQERKRELVRLKKEVSTNTGNKSSLNKELKALRKKVKEEAKQSKKLQGMMAKMQAAGKKESKAEKQLTTLRTALNTALDTEKKRESEVNALRSQLLTSTQQSGTRIAKLQARVSELEGHLSTPREQNTPAATTSVVSDVRFRDYANVSRIEVSFSGNAKFEILEQREDKAVLLVRSASLPDRLQRSLDTSEFGSPVSLVSSYRSNIPGEDGSVRLVASLRNATPNRVVRVENGLVWEFDRVQGASTPTRVLPQNQPRKKKSQTPSKEDASRLRYYPNMVGQATSENAVQNPYFSRRKKKKKYKGKRINLTIKDADIQHVLTFLAKEGGVNIVAGDEVTGNVSFHLENIPWDLALDMILKAKGFDYVKEQGVYRVALAETITKEVELELEKKKKLRDLRQLVVRLIPVNYADGTELSSQLEKILSNRGTVTVDLRTNTLIVKDTEDYIIAAEDLVRRLDTQTPQVLIEARIVEASSSFVRDVGIQWGGDFAMSPVFGNETGLAFPSVVGVSGGASGEAGVTDGLFTNSPGFAVNLPAPAGEGAGGALGLTLGSLSGSANLNLRLSAQEQEGNVKIISSPRISTLDNRTAVIKQGVSIPISVVSSQGVNTQFFNADLQLEATPHVTQDGNIAMSLNISKNEPNFGQTGANGTPTIQKKEATTELLLRDGDTTVIGGIYTRNSGENYSKVPVLGDIPILGWLFKTKSQSDQRSELLIFITPRIINRPAALQAASE